MRGGLSWPRLLLLLATSASPPAVIAADAQKTRPIVLRMLFVGDSCIYAHRLPDAAAEADETRREHVP